MRLDAERINCSLQIFCHALAEIQSLFWPRQAGTIPRLAIPDGTTTIRLLAMSLESIPHVSLGASLLIIFLICVGLVLLRGMAKILVGSVIVAASAWVAWMTWQLSPILCFKLLGKSDGILVLILPVIAFALSFWLILTALRFLLLPFEMFQSDQRPKTSLLTGLLVAVIPTFVLFLIAASLIHHFGTVEEVRAFAKSEKNGKAQSYLHSFKTSLDSILPDSWMRKLDPMTDPDRVKAAMLVTHRSHREPTPIIDPETGHPYPRAIVVDDPELQNLARQGRFGALIRHPLLTKALDEPNVRKILDQLKFQ